MNRIATILTIGLLLSSLAVWGIVLERLFGGQPLLPCRVPATRSRPWMAMGIVGLWVTFSLSGALLGGEQQKLPAVELDRAIRVTLLNVMEQCISTFAMILALSGLGARSLSRYGIDIKLFGERVLWGISGYLASIIPVVLMNILMAGYHNSENRHPYLQLLAQQDSLQLLIPLMFSAVIMAPLGEELMYRVILQGSLQRVVGPWMAIPIASAIFSAVHGFPDMVSLFPLALILGFLYWRTGSYLVSVTAHASFNAVNICMVLLSPVSENS